MDTTKTDIVIIGGGLAGLSLACLLGTKGIDVTILEAADPEKPMIGDERTTAISYGSQRILEQAGVWDNLQDQGAQIRNIQILDGHSSVLLNFLSREVEEKEFGTILENAAIRKALYNKIKANQNIHFIAPAKVKGFKPESDHISVNCENGKIYQAKLAIGADGRRSATRAWMGIPTRTRDYKQTAIICIAAHEHPHNNIAVEHFWPEGPFAILPMTDKHDENGNILHRSSVVFTEHTRPGKKSYKDFNRDDFEIALRKKFPSQYGHVQMLGERTAYPLTLCHAERYISERMVLIADAAHGIHPIAGQGLNLGFRDIDCLAQLLDAAKTHNQDFGNQDLLKTYQQKRRPDNIAMVAVTDGLVKLFSNNVAPIRLARRIGLKAVGKIPLAKRFFMKQAMADRSNNK